MRSGKRIAAVTASAVALVAAAVVAVAVFANRPPSDWPQKAEFCAHAEALEVGSLERTPEEHQAVLEGLAATAPDELADEFDDLLHSVEHQDPSLMDEDRIIEVGEYMEETCGVNLPGVTAA
ncbi:hypothetical protein [Glycomyces albidus]|uniref:Uncharacterized protein n=1 Tax=Glycomyces albidus TaxID=2656774 RepID=A0A6L5GAK0_9ACTN|nr:hypothetical protein [Glycomyces albidus]MQM26606.1 hypothetical protein [Glycomyces albidus]